MSRIGRSALLGLAGALAVGAGAGRLAAQQRPDAVQGRVRSGGAGVPYAVVDLGPSGGRQFTDDSGAFRFFNVPPGTYRLVARQIGYHPLDTTVVKVARVPLTVAVQLEPLVVELAAINVTAPAACTAPGPPDSTVAPQLAALLEQIRENAERYAFLADSYPFRYRMSRSFADYDAQGRVVSTSTDTIRDVSTNRVRYRPGNVLATGLGPERKLAPIVRLPNLSDFADSAFQANHCFVYHGTVDRDGGRYVRFDLVPAVTLRTPDIEGEVYLDGQTYQIRSATIRLTHAPRALPGLLSTSSTLTFAELYPNILILRRMEGELVPEPRNDVRTPIVRMTEVRQLIDVRFERPLPGTAPSGP
jgi:hypothetical protein